MGFAILLILTALCFLALDRLMNQKRKRPKVTEPSDRSMPSTASETSSAPVQEQGEQEQEQQSPD